MLIGDVSVSIDPDDLLDVRFAHEGRLRRVIALSLSFVPIQKGGRRHIVAELLYDPENLAPTESYVALDDKVKVVRVWPKAIVSVRPYQVG